MVVGVEGQEDLVPLDWDQRPRPLVQEGQAYWMISLVVVEGVEGRVK